MTLLGSVKNRSQRVLCVYLWDVMSAWPEDNPTEGVVEHKAEELMSPYCRKLLFNMSVVQDSRYTDSDVIVYEWDLTARDWIYLQQPSDTTAEPDRKIAYIYIQKTIQFTTLDMQSPCALPSTESCTIIQSQSLSKQLNITVSIALLSKHSCIQKIWKHTYNGAPKLFSGSCTNEMKKGLINTVFYFQHSVRPNCYKPYKMDCDIT